MKFVSIGPWCRSAEILRNYKLVDASYPFDWVFSSLVCVKDCIEDKFNKFLDTSFLYDIGKDSSKHRYYNQMINTKQLQLHHGHSRGDWNFFNHHNLFDQKVLESHKRRCDRFMSLIEGREKVCLVYINYYNNEIEELIKFAEFFSDKKNIFILGLVKSGKTELAYENRNTKIFNCKIEMYSIENHELVFNSFQ